MRRTLLIGVGVGALCLTSALPARADIAVRVDIHTDEPVLGLVPVALHEGVATTCDEEYEAVVCDVINRVGVVIAVAELNVGSTHVNAFAGAV